MPVTRLIIIQLVFLAVLIGAASSVSATPANRLFQKGLDLFHANQFERAKVAFLKAINTDPIQPNLLGKNYYHLAKTCFRMKEYNVANQYAQQSVIYFKDHATDLAQSYELLGKINFYQKNYTAAEQAFILNLHHHPKSQSKHYMFLAKTFVKSKKLPEAINTLDQGIAQFGDLQEFHDKALALEIKLYRYQDATNRIEYLIAQGQRPIHNLIKLGELHHHRGNIDEARQSFSKAKSLFNSLPSSKRKSPYMKELFKTIQSRMELALH